MPCLHSFCKKCLEQQLEQQGSSDGSIKCPTCATVSPLPSGGVSSLPSNLWLAHQAEVSTYQHKIEDGGSVPCDRCMKKTSGSAVAFCCNCCLFLCSSCKEDHQWWRETLSHELVDVGEKTSNSKSNPEMKVFHKPVMCTKHPKEELKLYCNTCQFLVCQDCSIVKHREHTLCFPEDVAEKEKESLQETLKQANDALVQLEAAISKREIMKRKIKIRKSQASEEIKQQFEGIYNSLQEREQVLHSKCEEIANQKLTVLNMEMEDMEKFKERIAFSTQIASGAEDLMPAELLSTKKTIQDNLQRGLSSFIQLELEPGESDDIPVVVDTAALDEAISEFGSVSGGCDPAQCTVEEGLVIPLATVGKEREVKVALKDYKGQVVCCGEVPVTGRVEVTGDGLGSVLPVDVKCESGHASLSFKPDVVGEHQLIVKVKNRPIAGSPYKIWSRQSRAHDNISSSKHIFRMDTYSYGVAVHHNGDVFGAACNDSMNDGAIEVFSSKGSHKLYIRSKVYHQSRGLAIIGDVLYAVDKGNQSVHKFSFTGEHFDQFGSNEGQFKNPRGICTDGKGHILVADYDNERIQIFTTDGNFASSIDCHSAPYDVAVSNTGNIHVTLHTSDRVAVYSAEGQYLTSYNAGVSLQSPTGIAIDEQDYRYVVSHKTGHICLFNPDGKLESRIACPSYPCFIALDIHGYIYVSSLQDKCISKF